MKQKVLFVATVLRGHILVFHLPYMQWFREKGYEVHVCARNDMDAPAAAVPYCDRYVDLAFARSPAHPQNILAYKQLKRLINHEKYALIHCHTPVGGMIARLAARVARKHGTKVLYTAHGFHFFSGAPLLNWLLYYPAERWLARFTDLLITINTEDYRRARSFRAGQVEQVPGVGVDRVRFDMAVDKQAVRRGLGISMDAPVAIVVGEHIPRKNHETALRAVSRVRNCHLLFCGVGEETKRLEMLAGKLNMRERVHFLGFRDDIPALLSASDVFLFPSFQEGMPVSLMEAMASGLPCVVSRVRGNMDLIRPGDGGMLRNARDAAGFTRDIEALLADQALCNEMGERNRNFIHNYSLNSVRARMIALYLRQLRPASMED